MKKTVLKAACVVLTLVLAGCQSGPLKGLKKEENNFYVNPDKKYEKLIEVCQNKANLYGYEGALMVATDDDIVLFGGPNAKNVEGKPIDPYTTYDIGSCSKVFTAVGIFQLIEQGKLSLDDTLDKFFPEYEKGKDITIYNVLHMQSGISDYCNDPALFWEEITMDNYMQYFDKIWQDGYTDEEFLQNLYKADLIFEPGTKQEYSNTNYVILAMIIEQIEGVQLCDYLQKNIFDVCKMEHTTSMVMQNETSVPTNFDEVRDVGMVNENGYAYGGRLERGCGGIHTCMADLIAFDRALFAGKLVNSSSLAEMMNYDMEYGCGIYPLARQGHAYGHSGSNGCYVSINAVIETEEFGRVYLVGSTCSGDINQGESLMTVMQAAVDLYKPKKK
ncbi:MAG: beta-lactamase family protein [Clostridiales bacterium]|nr:beta-lactamase family protein [Clostridiales bacterium]